MCIIIYINTHIGAEETCFQGRRTGSRRKEKKSHEGPTKEVERLRPYLFLYIYTVHICIHIVFFQISYAECCVWKHQVQVLWGLAACCTETFSFFGIDVCNNLGPLWAKVFTKLNKRFVFKWHESTTWIANLDARVYIHVHIHIYHITQQLHLNITRICSRPKDFKWHWVQAPINRGQRETRRGWNICVRGFRYIFWVCTRYKSLNVIRFALNTIVLLCAYLSIPGPVFDWCIAV